MSHFTIYVPKSIRVRGRIRFLVPHLSEYIGNAPAAAARTRELRKQYPNLAVRRLNGCISTYD